MEISDKKIEWPCRPAKTPRRRTAARPAQKPPHRPPSHRTSTKPSGGRGATGARPTRTEKKDHELPNFGFPNEDKADVANPLQQIVFFLTKNRFCFYFIYFFDFSWFVFFENSWFLFEFLFWLFVAFFSICSFNFFVCFLNILLFVCFFVEFVPFFSCFFIFLNSFGIRGLSMFFDMFWIFEFFSVFFCKDSNF